MSGESGWWRKWTRRARARPAVHAGQLGGEHPLANQIFSTIRNRRALYVAVFLHDIAKGRPEDHSEAGAIIARKLGPRFGLTEADFGSNPAGMRTRARRDGTDWVLNGTKMWITNGNLADVVLFGAFLVWAVLNFRSLRQRDRAAGAEPLKGALSGTLLASAIGLLVWAVVAFWAHALLIGVSPLGG